MDNSASQQINYSSAQTYFAALPIDELLPHLNSKISDYYEFCLRYKFLDKWKRTYLAYYGMSQSGTDTSKLGQGGSNGEEYILKVNDFRSLIQSLLTMTTSQRPAMQPKANNTDSKSMNQTVLARTVLDYYMIEKHLEAAIKDAVEFALIGGQGYVVLDWNANAGDIYQVDPTTQKPVHDGDLEFKAFHPIDIVREVWGENAKSKWKIIREFENKYDLAATHPELAQQIIGIDEASDFMKRYSNISYDTKTGADHIPVWQLRHEKTEALPNGRLVKFVGSDICLIDGPLPFDKINVHEVMPGPWHGTSFGYTVAYDLLGIQTNLDALNSIVATNQMNYGVQNVLLPKGGEYNVFSLAQGLNGIEYDPRVGEPKPLNLLSTPKEIVENITRLEHKQETLSGVNSVARGNVDRDMSGAALALISAQAVQFNGGLQQSYNFLLESVGTGVIEILKDFATTPRLMSISGKSNRARVQEFKGEDLAGINRVGVEQVNPLSKTASGRMTMADNLLKQGLIKTPQHYFEVIMTGSLDALMEHETSQMLFIRSENEDLADGKPATAILTDIHDLHIKEHSTVCNSPEARQNPQIVKAMTDHIQQHLEILKNPNVADILHLLGQQSLASPPPPPGAPGPGGPPQGPPQMHPPGPAMPQMVNPQAPVVQQAQGVKPPNMPTLPKAAPPGAQDAYSQMKSNAQI